MTSVPGITEMRLHTRLRAHTDHGKGRGEIHNRALAVGIHKMTRKALAMIKALADAEKKDDEDEDGEKEEEKDEDDESKAVEGEEEEESKYTKFWKAFGKYIKMGLIEDAANRTRLAKLLRYATSKSGDKEISLEDYVANMKEDQKNIYYISGEDKDSLLKSPSCEKLLAKDIEIIFMTDSVDEYTVQHLTEFEGKRLINASREGLKLEEGDKEKKREEQYKEMFKPLLDFANVTIVLRAIYVQPHLFLQLPVHGRLGALITVHAALGELPRVAAIDATPPQNLVLVITDHNPNIGTKAVAVDHAFFVFCLLQNRFPEVDQILARD